MAAQLGLGASTLSGPEWIEDKRMVRPHHLEALSRWVRESPELVVDYETDGLKVYKGHRAFMVGFFAPDRGARVVDLRLTGPGGLQAVADGLSARTGVTIGHNLKMELAHSKGLGFKLGGKLWDNYAASFAYDERLESHAQDELVRKYLGRDTPMAKALEAWMQINLGSTDRGHDLNPNAIEVPYNIEDVSDAWDLYRFFRPALEKQGRAELVWTDGALTRPVEEMEATGLLLDTKLSERLIQDLTKRRADVYKLVTGKVGRVDLASHQDLFGLLYGRFGLPMHSDLEKHGKLDDDVLSWMLTLDGVKGTDREAIIEGVREWRELDKMLGTYLLPWTYEHQTEGILHPNLNLATAKTRRFTADNPNLQNIPTRTDLGKEIRRALIATGDWTVYTLDYSQIEYRAFVHYCGEPRLVQGYRQNPDFDIHQMIAELCSVDRKDGKHLNFGMLFGMGIEKLARKLRCSKERAKAILERYHSQIPTVKQLKRRLEMEVRSKGYVQDLYGGRRHLTVEESYKAINTICQMTAADLTRRAIVNVAEVVAAAHGLMMLQVHDEIQFRLPGRNEPWHLPVVRDAKAAMIAAARFNIPVGVDAEFYDDNWANLRAVEGL